MATPAVLRHWRRAGKGETGQQWHNHSGAAIAGCYPEGNQSEQAKARLRRLLACTSTSEACRILRPLLALMASRSVTPDFAGLLNELQWFSGSSRERIRARWAQEFYRRAGEAAGSEARNSHD